MSETRTRDLPRRSSIRARLLRLVLAVTLPLVGLIAWSLYSAAQDDSQQARQQVLYLAQATASETSRFLAEAQTILNGLAARPAVSALDPAHCDPILADALALMPRFANVVTMAMDGRVLCSAVPPARATRGDPDRFLKLLRGPGQLTIGLAAPGVVTGRWVLPVGRALLNARGEAIGAVVLPIDLARLPLLPNLEGFSAAAVVGIVAGDGTVLARSRESERFVGIKVDPGRPALRQRSGTAEVIGLDGIPRIQAYAAVPGTDWIALASLPAGEVFASAKARIAQSILIAIAILSVVVLLALRWSRSIRDPIAAMSSASRAIAAGKLDARVPVDGMAEFADFGTQFNRMLDARAQAEASVKESEERLRLFIQYAPSAIAMFDRDMRYVAVSRRWLADYGLPDQELVGRSHYEVFPDLPERWKEIHRRGLAGETLKADEDEFRRADGSAIWLRWEVQPWRTSDGAIGGVIIFSEDVTQRKLAEQQTREGEERFRALVEQSISGACIVDREGRFVYVNPRLVSMLGYDSDIALVGHAVLEIAAPESHDVVRQNMRVPLAGEPQRARYHFQAIRRDGVHITIGAHANAGTYRRQSVLIITVQDVTELHRAEEEVERTMAKLMRAARSTIDVVSNIGEIRDPHNHGHEHRVGLVSAAIATEMGFSADRVEGIRVAGNLHDVGKISVPAEILAKPSRLSRPEFELVKQHAQQSYEILKGVEFPWPVAQAAWQHHERMDGTGYPRGLKGEEIILEARILAVADTVEAMSSHRPYRPGLGIDMALAEIERGRDTLFDRNVVDACLTIFRKKGYTLPP